MFDKRELVRRFHRRENKSRIQTANGLTSGSRGSTGDDPTSPISEPDRERFRSGRIATSRRGKMRVRRLSSTPEQVVAYSFPVLVMAVPCDRLSFTSSAANLLLDQGPTTCWRTETRWGSPRGEAGGKVVDSHGFDCYQRDGRLIVAMLSVVRTSWALQTGAHLNF
jgi:hypothetical protein